MKYSQVLRDKYWTKPRKINRRHTEWCLFFVSEYLRDIKISATRLLIVVLNKYINDIHEKKLLDSDWPRAAQFKCNISAKSVTPMRKV